VQQPEWLIRLDIPSSYKILAGLTALALAVALLYRVGLLGLALGALGAAVRWCVRAGFETWRRLFAWASWPVFLALVLGLIVLGIWADAALPGSAAACGLVVTLLGVTACLAYMFIDLERYEVGRGFLATHNPLKGQRLAVHLIRYGDRVGVLLLVAAAAGAVGGFALLNLGLSETVGRRWYAFGGDGAPDAAPGYADFLAYGLIHLYSIVDVLDLARARHLLEVGYVRPVQWPARGLLTAYKAFFTLVLLQQVFASLRRGRLLAETVTDFWSPHPPIHERARHALPQHGAGAVGPLLASLHDLGAMTREQLDEVPLAVAALGPGSVPHLVRHLNDAHEHVRAVAAAALGHLHARAVLPLLVRLAHDPSNEVRECVAEALGDLGVPEPATAARPPEQVARWRRVAGRLLPWRGRDRPLPPSDPAGLAVTTLRTFLADPAPAVRVRAAAALSKLGRAAAGSADALTVALGDEDETVRCRAAEALGRQGAGAAVAVPSLVGLLADPSPPVKIAAAAALGALKEVAATAVPALIELLQDRDEAVRTAAASAIGRVGMLDGRAGEVLVAGLDSPDNVLRSRTAEALGQIGDVAAEEAAPALVEALADRNDQVRGKAAEALGRIGGAAAGVAVPSLVRALHDRDNWVSALAAEALGEMGESADRAVPSLVHALGHINAQVRANAAEALGKLGAHAADARAALVGVAGDADGLVRAAAVRALANIGGPDADARRAALADLGDQDPQVRAAAAEALGAWREPDAEAVDGLLRALDDPTDAVKVQAARVLPRLAGAAPRVLDALSRRLLEDDSAWVREQAAAALGELGPAAAPAGPALLRAAQTGEANVREQAVWALALIQSAEAAAAFIAGIKDADPEVRKVASGGWIKAAAVPPVAAPGLVEAVSDPEVQVRANAANALARLDDLPADAVPLLLECLADPSDGLRLNSALALCRAPLDAAGPGLRLLLDDPNLRVRLVAAGPTLAADAVDAKATAVVVEALDAPSPRLRDSAVGLIESLGERGAPFLPALRERAAAEPDPRIAERVAGAIRALESITQDTSLVG
jgi:HEAT repeat protein